MGEEREAGGFTRSRRKRLLPHLHLEASRARAGPLSSGACVAAGKAGPLVSGGGPGAGTEPSPLLSLHRPPSPRSGHSVPTPVPDSPVTAPISHLP